MTEIQYFPMKFFLKSLENVGMKRNIKTGSCRFLLAVEKNVSGLSRNWGLGTTFRLEKMQER